MLIEVETGDLIPRNEGPYEYFDFDTNTWKPAKYHVGVGRSLPECWYGLNVAGPMLSYIESWEKQHPEATVYYYGPNGFFTALRNKP